MRNINDNESEQKNGKMKKVLKENYPHLKLVGCSNGYVSNKDKVFKLYSKFNEDNLLEGKRLVKNYLTVRGCENEKL